METVLGFSFRDMYGYHHICEIDDMAAKLDLVFSAKKYTDFDITAMARKIGMRRDHFNEMAEQTRFRHSTLRKLSDALKIPEGLWHWEYSKFKDWVIANGC